MGDPAITELCEGSLIADLINQYAGGGVRRIAEEAEVNIVEGQGSHLIDDRLRQYLDLVSGYGVASLGHGHPRWVDAVSEQARSLSVAPFHNPTRATYLERLAEVLPPGITQTALFSGGAEAVEVAIRLTQQATGRNGILVFNSSFHGKTVGVRFAGAAYKEECARLGINWLRHADYPACQLHSASRYATCEESSETLFEQLHERTDLDNVGAVLVEPILGTAGSIPPQRHFLSELRAACSDRGWLLIFDESQTGFGRTGEMFASDLFGVIPDVLVMGKGMGGGVPLAGVAAAADLWASSSLDRPSATSSSFGGNPLACAAGLAVLDVLTQPYFLPEVKRVGLLLSEGLDELAASSQHVSWPRGVGMMLGFDLVDPDTGCLADRERSRQVFRRCRDRGLLIAADVPRVRLCPPLTLSAEEAQQALDVLSEVLA